MPKTKGRPPYGFLIFDCPSDHEIEGSLITESEAINAVLSNRNLGTRLKILCCTSSDRFKNLSQRTYPGIRYVHLSGHGSCAGLGMIGDRLCWDDVANSIIRLLPKLEENEQRVLTLSCCYSKTGAVKMSKYLIGYFSDIYHFVPDKIPFSTAITAWSMFYLKKKLRKPHDAIAKSINDFLGESVIQWLTLGSKKRP